YTVEIKTLNSKTTDIRLKMPGLLSDREFSIRKFIQDQLVRGRVDLSVYQEGENGSAEFAFNGKLFKMYYDEIQRTTEALGIQDADIFSAVMRIPAVVSSGAEQVNEEEWQLVLEAITKASVELTNYRLNEGKVLAQDLQQRVHTIKTAIPRIQAFEAARTERLRERLKRNMEEYLNSDKIDANRFEQEIMYYLERIDITEEKIRLDQHCDYFLDQMIKDDPQVGKVLAFISQEMGREINTLGSKAQDSDIQQVVIMMKDELEKIKEQLANIL
ncbi:MAG TPA: DUF1732 domain-containing protein, partial [Saprospiraceae bacterium]|nr:DUF1732 domain-containing protein [Saprospiraceae bacterium]